ncbi:hypothetical protein GGD67_004736 [Bradyrhizobium sp. IAR9]|nr:hypothetical protein [Bradyrhizobium sp. IAR9]
MSEIPTEDSSRRTQGTCAGYRAMTQSLDAVWRRASLLTHNAANGSVNGLTF